MNILSRLDKREIIKEGSPGTCLLPSSGCCLCCCRCFHFVQFLNYTEMQVRPTLSAAVSCRILQYQRLNLAVRDPTHLSYCTGSHITNLHSYQSFNGCGNNQVLHNFIQINKVLHTFEIDGFVINTTFCKSIQKEFPKTCSGKEEKITRGILWDSLCILDNGIT